ncbi:hypothetical protein HanPSC8_Chr02g0076981 [Helianthus annuus]|nr:hypothetical protein HanPSC8_Chr02g0076981 [Helianthus annuus]
MTPLDVVVRILNNQLSSLMWIDEKVMLFFHIFIFLSLSSLNVVHKCLSDFEYCFFFRNYKFCDFEKMLNKVFTGRY